jgi:hypothetical protein
MTPTATIINHSHLGIVIGESFLSNLERTPNTYLIPIIERERENIERNDNIPNYDG